MSRMGTVVKTLSLLGSGAWLMGTGCLTTQDVEGILATSVQSFINSMIAALVDIALSSFIVI